MTIKKWFVYLCLALPILLSGVAAWLFQSSAAFGADPSQPVNISPVNGAIDVTLVPKLESSAFCDTDNGYTQAASQWQVTSTAGDYSAPVFDSNTDTRNLTSFEIPTGVLQHSTTYYWRVRHQDGYGAWSTWSVETSFTTSGIGLPQRTWDIIGIAAILVACLIGFAGVRFAAKL